MNRRADLELLRVVLCASVILQHAVLVFAAEPRYHVKAAEASAWASVLYEALRIAAMPPFFALAGWAAIGSLRGRGARDFLRARVSRLLVPLAAGIFLLGPIIKYVELRHGRDLSLAGFRLVTPIQMDFLSFLPRYYTRIALNTWSHLWFLTYLLIYSVALLPILTLFATARPPHAQPHRAVVYAPAALTALVLAAGHGYWPYLPNLISDWTNFAYFALCFLGGALIAVWPMLEDCLRQEAWRAAALSGLSFIGVLWFGESIGGRALVGIAGWGCVIACWGLVLRMRPAWSPALRSLSQATFPVYILHHVPLLLLASWMVTLPLAVGVRIAVIAVASTLVSCLLFQWLIRPWPVARWLAGGG